MIQNPDALKKLFEVLGLRVATKDEEKKRKERDVS